MSKKQLYLYILLAAVLIISYVIVVFMMFRTVDAPKAPANSVIPTKAPSSLISQIKQKKKLLSQGELTLSQKLISSENTNGLIYKSKTFTLYYLKNYDVFQDRVTTTNILLEKSELKAYLVNQGFTGKSICNLPIEYYANSQLRTVLGRQNIKFDPKPDGC